MTALLIPSNNLMWEHPQYQKMEVQWLKTSGIRATDSVLCTCRSCQVTLHSVYGNSIQRGASWLKASFLVWHLFTSPLFHPQSRASHGFPTCAFSENCPMFRLLEAVVKELAYNDQCVLLDTLFCNMTSLFH